MINDFLKKLLSCFVCRSESECNTKCKSKCLIAPKKMLFKIFSNKKLNDNLETM